MLQGYSRTHLIHSIVLEDLKAKFCSKSDEIEDL